MYYHSHPLFLGKMSVCYCECHEDGCPYVIKLAELLNQAELQIEAKNKPILPEFEFCQEEHVELLPEFEFCQEEHLELLPEFDFYEEEDVILPEFEICNKEPLELLPIFYFYEHPDPPTELIEMDVEGEPKKILRLRNEIQDLKNTMKMKDDLHMRTANDQRLRIQELEVEVHGKGQMILMMNAEIQRLSNARTGQGVITI